MAKAFLQVHPLMFRDADHQGTSRYGDVNENVGYFQGLKKSSLSKPYEEPGECTESASNKLTGMAYVI